MKFCNSIMFNNYKCFKSNTKIENIKRINVFIGKNNSGKTSVLNIIENLKERKMQNIDLKVSIDVDHETIAKELSKSNGNYEYYLHNVTDQSPIFDVQNNIFFDRNSNYRNLFENPYNHVYWAKYGLVFNSVLDSTKIYKISSERDIVPERYLNNLNMDSKGNGITNTLCAYINDSDKDYKKVEIELLKELNAIMRPDCEFETIRIQKLIGDKEERWEIYLKERNELHKLSQMGSGIKTIIMVLVYFIVMYNKNNNFMYLFEELENNLHPALQRRLFNYIYNFVKSHENTILFLTTHSHIAINSFYNHNDASIYHIYRDDKKSKIINIDNNLDKIRILDDLEVKASDIFQSNGIIWVEGPSDRIYIKKWLEIVDSSIKENEHYQFLYYGGKNLKQYGIIEDCSDDEVDKIIDVLLINRNSAIVMDSDIIEEGKEINNTKKRIVDSFNKHGLFNWITDGKEIENYLKADDINNKYGSNLSQIGKYDLFPVYINETYNNFENKKVRFASSMVECMNEKSLDCLDLRKKIMKLATEIKKWNK